MSHMCYPLFLFYKLLNMFRATMYPSSGADDCVVLSHCVCSSLYMKAFIYSELHKQTQRVTICCHNTDLVHVNGHDRIILVICSQALYKAP